MEHPVPTPSLAALAADQEGLQGARKEIDHRAGPWEGRESGCPRHQMVPVSPGCRFQGAVLGRFCAVPGLVRREFSPFGDWRDGEIGNPFRFGAQLGVIPSVHPRLMPEKTSNGTRKGRKSEFQSIPGPKPKRLDNTRSPDES